MNSITFSKEYLNNKIVENVKQTINVLESDLNKRLNEPFFLPKYFNIMSDIDKRVREFIRNMISSTFEEIDEQFKKSKERKESYTINKSFVPRTLTTIYGDITFYRTYYNSKLDGSHHFFIDEALDLPKYDHYDPVVKSLAVDNSIWYSQSASSRITGERISDISTLFSDNRKLTHIPRQSIHNWINEWIVPRCVYDRVEKTPRILYVIADEKFIGCQDIKDKDIMAKCIICFEGVKKVGKNRKKLINRLIYTTKSSTPWEEFSEVLAQKYDLSQVDTIYLMSDGAKWLKLGISELKLEPQMAVKFLLCEFHYKQAVNNITTDKQKRKEILKSFNEDEKIDFKRKVEEIIDNLQIKDEKTKENKIKKLNYILNNYDAIKDMLKSEIGSSMESHISHYIASTFASRPKGFSSELISKYFRLNDYKNNGFNLLTLFKNTYKNEEEKNINEKELSFSMFDNSQPMPILASGERTPTYLALRGLAYGY